MAQYITIVFELTKDCNAQSAIVDIMEYGNSFKGGKIVAITNDNEISNVDRYISRYGNHEDIQAAELGKSGN